MMFKWDKLFNKLIVRVHSYPHKNAQFEDTGLSRFESNNSNNLFSDKCACKSHTC